MTGQSETKHTPGMLAADEYGRDSDIHIRSPHRHWSIAVAHATGGCTDPNRDVSEVECRANAARIVLTWNCHDELIEALRLARDSLGRNAAYDAVCAALYRATSPTP